MKSISTIGLLLLLSCTSSDDFFDTKRVITTDKNEYRLGDKFEITLTIHPLDNEKRIRIYKNYKNLEISFALVDYDKGIYNEDWTPHSGRFLDDSEIIDLTIEKQKPFIKTFKGEIIDDKIKVTLSIPELKMKVSFDKAKVINKTAIRVHGYCNPINPRLGDSLDDHFEVKDIKIIGE